MPKEKPDHYYDELVATMEPHSAEGTDPPGFQEFITAMKPIRALIRATKGQTHPIRVEVWFRKNGAALQMEMPELILPQSEREWDLWFNQLKSLLPGFIRDEERKLKE